MVQLPLFISEDQIHAVGEVEIQWPLEPATYTLICDFVVWEVLKATGFGNLLLWSILNKQWTPTKWKFQALQDEREKLVKIVNVGEWWILMIRNLLNKLKLYSIVISPLEDVFLQDFFWLQKYLNEIIFQPVRNKSYQHY